MDEHSNQVVPPAAASVEDVRSLAWVQDEVRRSLEAAHKAVHRYLREAESLRGSDVDDVDPAVLRGARTHLHQAAGALEVIGLPAAAMVVRAGEQALRRLIERPRELDVAAAQTLQRAWFALGDYLGRLAAGKPAASLSLFPHYRALMELAGADRIHPADLWEHDWRWRVVAREPDIEPRAADAASRELMERLILRLMRTPDRTTLRRMSDLCATLGAEAKGRRATMWRLAAGFFEAQAAGLLRQDVYVKRAAPRLLAQAHGGMRGGEVSDRLARDLLFFCAQAVDPGAELALPRLRLVRQAYGLDAAPLPDYEAQTLGRLDPALLALGRKRAAAAREAWDAATSADPLRVQGSHSLSEAFALLRDSLERLYPAGDELGQALTRAVQQAALSQSIAPPLAMEVATALLYLEASLEEGDLDDPRLHERIRRLAARIDAARQGGAAMPLDDWMEELYRRVADRQTMGSVVRQLRTLLADVERSIDQHSRDPAAREALAPVPGWLGSAHGVLSVLGLDAAAQAVQRVREDVERLAQPAQAGELAAVPVASRYGRLADNLGTLGFLVDMLAMQPLLARRMFRFDPTDGRLRALATRQPQAAPAADETGDVGDAGLAERLRRLGHDATQSDVSDEALVAEMRSLALLASLAEERRLADGLGSARVRLERAADAVGRGAVRAELADWLLAGASGAGPLRDAAPTGAAAAGVPVPVAPHAAALEGAAARAADAAPSGTGVASAASPAAEGAARVTPADAEMLEVFLEESAEVLKQARAALARLDSAQRDLANDLTEVTSIRRAFHTLKGSSRMVGLSGFGEAAWACEQLYNARLALAPSMDADLRRFTTQVLAYLEGWTHAIRTREPSGHEAQPVIAAADAMRRHARFVQLPLPMLETVVEPAPPREEALPTLASELPVTAGDIALAAPEEPAADEAAAPLIEPEPEPEPEPEQQRLVEPTASIEPAVAPERVAQPEAEPQELTPQDSEPLPEAAGEALMAVPPDEPVKVIGPLRIDIGMFNIFLNEADELSRRLATHLAEWATEPLEPPGDEAVALAHSLAGSSATVGFADLAKLARSLEHALSRSNEAGRVADIEAALYTQAGDDIRRLLHQFAAGFLVAPREGLVEQLQAHEPEALGPAARAERIEAGPEVGPAPPLRAGLEQGPAAAFLAPPAADVQLHRARAGGAPEDDDIDLDDVVDAELFPAFCEEADERLPELQAGMREWAARPGEREAALACMRTLHTFKGAARLAGAMRLGEIAHRLETAIERLLAAGSAGADEVEPLLWRVDALDAAFQAVREAAAPAAGAYVQPHVAAAQPLAASPTPPAPVAAATGQLPQPESAASATAEAASIEALAPAEAAVSDAAGIDWSRLLARTRTGMWPARLGLQPSDLGAVRVKAALLDRLVNQTGEASIARTRIEADLAQTKASLADLSDNLERLRRQLRDVEVQSESQIISRLEAAKAAAVEFDPLEMDRYTRVQELTRMLAESVNDVATVQRSLQRALQSSEDQIALQGRLMRALQDDLMRTRMVEFESLSDRLYRVVRQTSKEAGKHVRLDIVGGSIEIDRSVLERMTAPFEHLLRNSIVHGIEPPVLRQRSGKEPAGQIEIKLVPEGNEVAIEFRDDGAGLDLRRIRERAVAMGLVAADVPLPDAAAAELIYAPGFSTAERVSEIAGRGVGMDVVRSEVLALGGRIQTSTTPGQGTSLRMILPLTTAVTQVVMVRCGELKVAVPSNLVEVVRREDADAVNAAYRSGRWLHVGEWLPFHWLGALLGGDAAGAAEGRSVPVVIVRSAAQRVAIHVDEVIGNQDVVVKNLGPQLSRLPGLAGITLLPSGAIAAIYNPVALVACYGGAARQRLQQLLERHPGHGSLVIDKPSVPPAPLVLIVDDSLTVRRVTQRLLAREGYRVVTAKDGIEALERIAQERPGVILCDIEMPRMDGFDFVRNLRADPALAALPVVFITSRIAQKHRDYARELGIEHYLGKPYGEEELLALVEQLARRTRTHA